MKVLCEHQLQYVVGGRGPMGGALTGCPECDGLESSFRQFQSNMEMGNAQMAKEEYGKSSVWLGGLGGVVGARYGAAGSGAGTIAGAELGRVVDAYGSAYNSYMDYKQKAEDIYGIH